MPAPLFWLGASAVALLAGAKYNNDNTLGRYASVLPGSGNNTVVPIDGAVVTCGVFGVFEHTGIWVDGNIIELKGNGLVRGVSPLRFLQDRSGEDIYVACNEHHQPLIMNDTKDRAVSRLFSYSPYNVIENNCHKFVWQCVSGLSEPLTQFTSLNKKLSEAFLTSVNWQRAVY